MAFSCAIAGAGIGGAGLPGTGLFPDFGSGLALDRLGGPGLGGFGFGSDPFGQILQQEMALMQTAALDSLLVRLLMQLLQNLGQSSNAGLGNAGLGSASPSDAGASSGGASGATGSASAPLSGPTGPLNSGSGPVPSKNGFAQALLQKIGAPVTPENIKFLDAWQKAEGGSADNPFNTTQDAPGATRFNSVGVKRYPSMEEGLDATAKTLLNGKYGNIVAALKSGNSAHAAAQALANSPWGTGALVEKIVG